MDAQRAWRGMVTGIVAAGMLLAGNAAVQAGQAQEVLKFRSGGVSPVTDPSSVAMERLSKLVKERTGGKVDFTHFGGGQIGGERDMVEGVQLGTVGMVITGVTGHPIYDAFFLPYVFRDREHMWKVLDGPIGEEWNQRMIKERGMRVLGYMYRGPRQLTTTKRMVKTAADVKGLKIRVPEIAPMLATWKALGASPTPMAWPEVFTGLQQGSIEGQENPLELIASSKLWEVQKFLTLTNHVRVAWIVLLDERLWKRMTPETQQIMTSSWREVSTDMEKQILASEQKLIDEIKSHGVTVIEPDVESFRQAVKDVWRDVAPKAWGPGVYERIQGTR
ncbi:MAG TPA: TRAP transporter substrate-binding protein [Candidatus Methylomirabilis sp.]|nr:TRAP transporter substrate-binding protein [Candidatus Methylomirabilis sp.]